MLFAGGAAKLREKGRNQNRSISGKRHAWRTGADRYLSRKYARRIFGDRVPAWFRSEPAHRRCATRRAL